MEEKEKALHPDHPRHNHSHEHTHNHSHHLHKHVHNAEDKKVIVNRLARAIGHLQSVKRMVEADEDCSNVLIQLAAVRSALNNTGKLILKNHINECIVEAVEHKDNEAIALLNEAIDKFMK